MRAKVRVRYGQPIDLSAYYGREKEGELVRELLVQCVHAIAELAGRPDFEPQLAGRKWNLDTPRASWRETHRRKSGRGLACQIGVASPSLQAWESPARVRKVKSVMSDLTGKVAAVTGGGGILCGAMCRALAQHGAAVAVLDVSEDAAQLVAREILSAGGQAVAVSANVLHKESLEQAAAGIRQQLGPVDILINGAGGNKPDATASADQSFFDIPAEAIQWVFNLNCLGTILACQVFVRDMLEREQGAVINIASMAGIRPLTRVVAYSAAKAAIANFTQWFAVHLAQHYSPGIRVNAIAPGFFLTAQNEYLLMDQETQQPTERGQTILAHTPANRYGRPADLLGTLLWLVGDGAAFVSGTVIPVDGGFSAFGGV